MCHDWEGVEWDHKQQTTKKPPGEVRCVYSLFYFWDKTIEIFMWHAKTEWNSGSRKQKCCKARKLPDEFECVELSKSVILLIHFYSEENWVILSFNYNDVTPDENIKCPEQREIYKLTVKLKNHFKSNFFSYHWLLGNAILVPTVMRIYRKFCFTYFDLSERRRYLKLV